MSCYAVNYFAQGWEGGFYNVFDVQYDDTSVLVPDMVEGWAVREKVDGCFTLK